MTKLPVVSGKDLIKYLSKKGFAGRPAGGSHFFLSKKNDDGTLAATTTVPLHRELDTGMLIGILKDVGIEREQFIREWYYSA